MEVYFDNAATTPIDERVVEVMKPYFHDTFGNPSSIHNHGRDAKSVIENARKSVALQLGASPSEIFFTSGGTESDNTAILGTILKYGIKAIITSPLEHHAVLHSAEFFSDHFGVSLHFVEIDQKGRVNLNHLEELVKKFPNALVTLMHGNNEVGNLSDISAIGELCLQNEAIFHSDMVQTVGHFPIDLSNLPVQLAAASAHKFHGPKGVGMLYVSGDFPISPFIHGGAQERNLRGGTENIMGIVGMAKALELANAELSDRKRKVERIKRHVIENINTNLPDIEFNGLSDDLENSLYTVLSLSTPPSDINEMLLFKLDISKISLSGGSACASGSSLGSHVIEALDINPEKGTLRLSFSHMNTLEEADYVLDILSKTLG